MRLFSVTAMFLALLVIAAGCSSASDASVEAASVEAASSEPATTTTPIATTVPAVSSATTATPTTATPTTVTPTTVAPSPACTRVTDFAEPGEQQPWRVTLDGVMGGLSSGDVAFEDSTMVFTGELVTSGGGFALLRTPLGFDVFESGSYLMVRARTDGRGYEMVFKDSVDGRRSQLFHEAPIPFAQTDQWQEVRVELTDLFATSNGRPVDAEPFDKDAASEMGIILKDGVDGDFRLEVDWVEVCAEPQ